LRKRILIAEDEPSILLSLEFLLANSGYEVSVARDGAEALRLTDTLRPDLIVLDIMLPVVNGFEVCHKVRSTAALGHIKILMLTARGRESEVHKGLASGAHAYMTKPFATRELVRTVSELLTPATG
jgi:DNA-binding response OmpR family regulator